MTLVLGWRRPNDALALRWRGPLGRTAMANFVNSGTTVASVIGPAGLSAEDSIVNPDDILDFIDSFDGSLN